MQHTTGTQKQPVSASDAPARILVVEDDEDIAKLLEFTFASAGNAVLRETEGPEGLEAVRREKPDLVILDVMLPGMDGFSVLREMRRDSATANTPVIMLTARAEEVDRIVGLELGADDYVVKPFSPRELVLIAKKVLSRTRAGHAPVQSRILRKGLLAVDPDAYRVTVDNEEVNLTATEFRLLLELFEHMGRVRSREQLLNAVWGYSFEGYARTVDTHVRRLRQKLGKASEYIETLRGVGYRFTE